MAVEAHKKDRGFKSLEAHEELVALLWETDVYGDLREQCQAARGRTVQDFSVCWKPRVLWVGRKLGGRC